MDILFSILFLVPTIIQVSLALEVSQCFSQSSLHIVTCASSHYWFLSLLTYAVFVWKVLRLMIKNLALNFVLSCTIFSFVLGQIVRVCNSYLVMCRSRMTFSDRLQKFYKKNKKQIIAVREDLQYPNTSKSREIREWEC